MHLSLLVYASMALFAIGVLGVLIKRNTLILFLSIEMMLNSANLLFVYFSSYWGNEIGLLWVFFVLLVAAAEAAVGLAIIIHLFRTRQLVDVDQYNKLKG
jgi:NADH-quinone oxidoreductase subunit K